MLFKRFKYESPPAQGLYWLYFSYAETDCDADAEGRTVGWHTGSELSEVTLAYLDPTPCDGLAFKVVKVDNGLPGLDLDQSIIKGFLEALPPELPEHRKDGAWRVHQVPQGELFVELTGFHWVAFKRGDGLRHVTLANAQEADNQPVPGFENPYNTYDPLIELEVGDVITHVMPLSQPVEPVAIEPAPAEPVALVTIPASVLAGLYAVSSGKVSHVLNGMCPDTVEGFEVRDDECPACIELIKADAALKVAGMQRPLLPPVDTSSSEA
ncbi:hypothetical protein [Pseudomonas sp. P108]|uniref:hypothetical protein n=1 Tax=Pseudomonas sp. P108 TaxID=1837993 RepID=UPI0029349100|nr:hypothetical protein [Pseudomonas sp. P108]WNZ87287.1 hypothetical protein QOM10_30520 [Pseudomonas sp. P108]